MNKAEAPGYRLGTEVDLAHRALGIEEALSLGHVVVECGPEVLSGHQVWALNPRDANGVRLWFDWVKPVGEKGNESYITTNFVDEGISYEGVKRRQGLLRRYARLDTLPEEISGGDLIEVRVGREVFSSQLVREVVTDPELVAAKKRLHIPRLAMSAE